jgi:hypothetical protein
MNLSGMNLFCAPRHDRTRWRETDPHRRLLAPSFLDRAFLTAPARRTAARRRTNHPVGRAVRQSIGLGMVNSAITAEISSHAAINRAATSIA